MDYLDIQEFADENNLDVREIESYHYRLSDTMGEYVADVYVKMSKAKTIVNRNSVFRFLDKTWHRFDIYSIPEMKKLLLSAIKKYD